ncbi:MAG: hypothetical protein U0871_00995 [Gemmataceae bacterium]
MRAMMKTALERMLDAEMDHHLDATRSAAEPVPTAKPNCWNGHSPKTSRATSVRSRWTRLCDRDGTFCCNSSPSTSGG